MDGRRFVHDPEDSVRFAALLSDGANNGVRLYHCEWKDYNGEKVVDGKRYLKTLLTNDYYTLVTPDGEMHHVKRASDVAKLFPEQKKQIKKFARKNHLSFMKSNRERSLTTLAGSIEGAPIVESKPAAPAQQAAPTTSQPAAPTLSIDEKSLMAGIPVLDNDSVAASVTSSRTKVYIVPGVKKAKASIAQHVIFCGSVLCKRMSYKREHNLILIFQIHICLENVVVSI